jgi:hypothetical protein
MIELRPVDCTLLAREGERKEEYKLSNWRSGLEVRAQLGRWGRVLQPNDHRTAVDEDAIHRSSPNPLQILTHVDVRIVLCTVRPHHDMKLWACS